MMATLDKVKMTLPDSTVFEARGDLTVTISQQPSWLFDGFQELFAAEEAITGSGGDLTEQVFQGAGSRIRRFQIDFAQWEGSTDSWGSAAADDDIMVKMQTLDNALASTRITSDNVATLEFGEYTSGGSFDSISVVPGEVTLPVNYEENTSVFRPTVNWLDAVDLDQTLHELG